MAHPRRSRAAERARSVAADAEPCNITGCKDPQARSFNFSVVAPFFGAGELDADRKGNVGLCKDHYKHYKKASKESRTTARANWD